MHYFALKMCIKVPDRNIRSENSCTKLLVLKLILSHVRVRSEFNHVKLTKLTEPNPT